MFKKIKVRLTWVNAVSYFFFLVIFLSIFFLLMSQIMNKIQEDSLESYAANNINKFLNMYAGPPIPPGQFELEADKVSFYYVISKDLQILYGQELHEGFYKQLQNDLQPVTNKEFKRYEYESENLLVMIQPVRVKGEQLGYIAIGQNVTSYYQLMKNVLVLGIILLILSSIGIAFLSYFLAKKSMQPIQHSYNLQKQFVSNASHELRTPLTVLYSSIELLEEQLKKNGNYPKNQVAEIKDEAQYMSEMLNSLLYLARADQNQVKLNIEKLNLSEILLQRTRRFARITNHLRFKINVEDELYMQGDKVLIEELIDIFLKNAITYTKVGYVSISAKQAANVCIVTIEDTGIGISEEDIPFIFDRFYRADKMRTSQGTGLGLSIAKIIIDLHKANVKVNSKLGEGTTFILDLPIK